MPYARYSTDERNALQAIEGMGLPKSDMAAILVFGGPPKDAEEYVFLPVVCKAGRRVRRRGAGSGGGGSGGRSSNRH
jgi:hypothetical protein